MNDLPPFDVMYQALVERDHAFEGVFFACVKTTGIFCRPTCTARKPRCENVDFMLTARDALLAGYRPCHICKPIDNGLLAPPNWVLQLLEEVNNAPTERFSDQKLISMRIEPARARRYFKSHYGMTFHAYHRARRMRAALKQARSGASLTGIGYKHGYDSDSGFRDAFSRIFGETPGRANRARCLLADWIDTPLGAMLAVANDDGLCLLEFVDRRAIEAQISTLRKRLRSAIIPGVNKHLQQTKSELNAYLDGTLREFTIPLVLRGTQFQLAVWKLLMAIPYGDTDTYSAMAGDIGRMGAQRAVGRANGDNRLAIIIPCHRVVRSDGTLCGYGGGLWRKKWLLEHERKHVAPRSHHQDAVIE